MLRPLFFFLSSDLIALILSLDLIRRRSSYPFLSNPTILSSLLSYHDLIAQPPTCSCQMSYMHLPPLHCAAADMRLPYVIHAVTMRYFTYIPSYLVVHSLASY